MAVDPLEAAAAFMDLAETAIPEFGMVMLAYVSENGHQGFTYSTLGKPNSMQVMGLIALVEDDVLGRFQNRGE